VAVITDRFAPSARAMAEVNGVPDYPFAVIDHPIADNDDEVLRAKAEQLLPHVVRLLTTR
jgi:hypothetical protein